MSFDGTVRAILPVSSTGLKATGFIVVVRG